MKTVKVEPNQTIYDLAVQHYGSMDAVAEILNLNPDIANDPQALIALGVDTLQDNPFRMDVAVSPDYALVIDETSKTVDNNITKKIEDPVTTYETWQELSPRYSRR